MRKAPSHSRRAGTAGAAATPGGGETLYAALDLGTNNCRLMIASFSHGQFRIVEAFSRIVRLGEGLAHSGSLSERAMERALKALKICAEKIEKRGQVRVRAVATQACRIARNGRDFVQRVERETGLKLTIISPQEEAHLSVMGCASLLDGRDIKPPARAALVMDVGGGSTELSWVELERTPAPLSSAVTADVEMQMAAQAGALRMARRMPRPRYWISMPVGVVTLAERFPEPENGDARAWFESMVAEVMARVKAFGDPEPLRPHFDCGEAYVVGTSGAITSLAGMHLCLERYDRSKVDGLWMSHGQCLDVIDKLLGLGRAGRELEPCIGRDRADLVLAGAAILEAVLRLWPCQRLRVADRGLREGLLLSMGRKKTRRRRRGRGGGRTAEA